MDAVVVRVARYNNPIEILLPAVRFRVFIQRYAKEKSLRTVISGEDLTYTLCDDGHESPLSTESMTYMLQ